MGNQAGIPEYDRALSSFRRYEDASAGQDARRLLSAFLHDLQGIGELNAEMQVEVAEKQAIDVIADVFAYCLAPPA